VEKTDSLALKEKILSKAREIGFDLCGVTLAKPVEHYTEFLEWIKQGKGGDMEYMKASPERRKNPKAMYPDVKSIISCIVNYYQGKLPEPEDDEGKISRYALGKDYHKVVKKMLIKLLKFIKSIKPSADGRAYVDTGAIMEKEIAAKSGLGWIGKNTLLVNPDYGSYLFLGEVLLNISLPEDEPILEGCKDCRMCIDACPTGALENERKLDASKCIAYFTIEHKGGISKNLKKLFGNWIYGCDICQDVCPYNKNPPITKISAFRERIQLRNISLEKIKDMDEETFIRYFQGTPIKRTGIERLKRNASEF